MVRRSYNLLVVGYYYKKNYGDELLLEVAQKLFCEKYHSKIRIICEGLGSNLGAAKIYSAGIARFRGVLQINHLNGKISSCLF